MLWPLLQQVINVVTAGTPPRAPSLARYVLEARSRRTPPSRAARPRPSSACPAPAVRQRRVDTWVGVEDDPIAQFSGQLLAEDRYVLRDRGLRDAVLRREIGLTDRARATGFGDPVEDRGAAFEVAVLLRFFLLGDRDGEIVRP